MLAEPFSWLQQAQWSRKCTLAAVPAAVLSLFVSASRAFFILLFSLSIMFWTAFLLRPSGSVRLSQGMLPAFSMIWKKTESFTQ